MDRMNAVHVFLSQAEAAPAAAPLAPAPPDLSFWGSMLNAGWVEQLVMLILVGFSVISWAIITCTFFLKKKKIRDRIRYSFF